MDDTRFDQMVRAVGAGITRRGMMAALGALSLAALPDLAKAKKPHRRRKPKREASRVSAASIGGSSLVPVGESDAEEIVLTTPSESFPLWDHTHLTVAVQGAGNADPVLVQKIHDAIGTWDQALDGHFDGLVRLIDVTEDHEQAVRADIRVHFLTKWRGLQLVGQAACHNDQCRNVFVKSEWTERASIRDVEEIEITPKLFGQVVVHELGHALGLGHTLPILSTNDIMGYGFLPWFHYPPREPVISACDLKALDEIWRWAVEGVEPYRPAMTEVTC